MSLRYRNMFLRYYGIPQAGDILNEVRPFQNKRKKELKEFGRSASSTPFMLTVCLVSHVWCLMEAIDLSPCQAALMLLLVNCISILFL